MVDCFEWVAPALPAPFHADDLLCPITHMMMREPVIASDGVHYDRQALSTWLRTSGSDAPSPMTRDTVTNFVKDTALQALVSSVQHQWKQSLKEWLGRLEGSLDSTAVTEVDASLGRGLCMAGESVFTAEELAAMLTNHARLLRLPHSVRVLQTAGWFCDHCKSRLSIHHHSGVTICADCLLSGQLTLSKRLVGSSRWYLDLCGGDDSPEAYQSIVLPQGKGIVIQGRYPGFNAMCSIAFVRPPLPFHIVSLPKGVVQDWELELLKAFARALHSQGGATVMIGGRLAAGHKRVLPDVMLAKHNTSPVQGPMQLGTNTVSVCSLNSS